MPFTWRINITPNPTPGGPAQFQFDDPSPDVVTGDSIIWSNQDTVPHFPCLATNQTLFMSNQIAAQSTSPSFVPRSDGTITYICSLHQGETGTIVVTKPATAAPVTTD
jgi:plastocyanin